MSKKISLSIKGKTYEKISESVVEVLNEQELSDDLTSWLEKNLDTIIGRFLEINKNAIVNTATDHRKEKKNLLLPQNYYNELYYGGVAGVIEGSELKLPRYDLTEIDDPRSGSEDANEDFSFSIRLQIRSRFDEDKLYFLATLLLRDKIQLNDEMVLSSEEDLYDYMLLFWYKSKLTEAYKKGFYKTYRRFEANDDRLKGAIDVPRHIRLNIGQSNGKIAYSYRENTLNNFLNHMIVVAYEYLKRKYPELVEQNFDNDPELRKIIETLKCEIGYEPLESKLLIKKNNRPIAHPYYTEYEDLRAICIKILRDEGVSLWDAEDEQTKSILFYLPDLWELFLEDKIRENSEIGRDLFLQGASPDNPNGESVIKVCGKNDDYDNYTLKTHPDYVFFDMAAENKPPYCILDAKFRKGLETKEGGKTGVGLDDYTKCIRDMNTIDAHATGVIFPVVASDGQASDEYKISKYNSRDVFYTFPVAVPKEKREGEDYKTYTEWKKEFDDFIAQAIGQIAKEVANEREYARIVRSFMNGFPTRQG